MSYVLDALRKSEQERQIAAGQHNSMLFPIMLERRPAARFGLIGLTLFIVVASAVVWWSWPKISSYVQNRLTDRSLPGNPTEAPIGKTTSRLAGTLQTPQSGIPLPVIDPPRVVTVVTASHSSKSISDGSRPSTRPARPRQDEAPEATGALGKESAETSALRPPPEKSLETSSVQAIDHPGHDLPLALQKELPPISISGFVSDGQGGSLVVINDKLLHEGEDVIPGLRLEKILANGVLLNYKGHRFQR